MASPGFTFTSSPCGQLVKHARKSPLSIIEYLKWVPICSVELGSPFCVQSLQFCLMCMEKSVLKFISTLSLSMLSYIQKSVWGVGRPAGRRPIQGTSVISLWSYGPWLESRTYVRGSNAPLSRKIHFQISRFFSDLYGHCRSLFTFRSLFLSGTTIE